MCMAISQGGHLGFEGGMPPPPPPNETPLTRSLSIINGWEGGRGGEGRREGEGEGGREGGRGEGEGRTRGGQ